MAAVSKESDLESLMKSDGLVAVVKRLKSDLELAAKATLEIAVIGESGSGRSSLINALGASGVSISGLESAAEREIGREPIKYQLSTDKAVCIWELPGIQPMNFKADVYLNSITFDRYHCFVILSGAQFEENAWQLAKEIQQKKKKFYFVRNKIDCDLKAAKQREETQHDEDKSLEYLRNLSVASWKKALKSAQVFLISSLHRDKFDFARLQEVLKADIPALKRGVALPLLLNHLSSLIEKKKNALLAERWKVAAALTSARVAAVPGAAVVCDIPLLLYCFSSYRSSFGLDGDSLATLGSLFGGTIEELKAEIKSIFAQDISASSIAKELLQMAGEEILESTYMEYVPLIGQAIYARRSYGKINALLGKALQGMAEDCKRIFEKALQ